MSDKQTFESRLRAFSAARRSLVNAALGYRLGFLGLAAGVAGLLLLSGWLPWFIVNLGLFAVVALWLVSLLVVWLVRCARFRSCLEEAFQIEQLAGTLNSRVISAWDFLHDTDSSALKQAVIRRAAEDLKDSHEARLDRAERDRRRLRFALVGCLFMILGLSPWPGFARVFDTLGQSWAELQSYLYPITYDLEPGPGQYVYRLGAKVAVGVQFNRSDPGAVRLVKQTGEPEPLALGPDRRARVEVTSDVEAEHILHFEFGARRTEEMTLVFTSPPALVNMQTELVYPPYTNQPPRSLESVQQRLLALPATRITLGFTFSKELDSATLALEEWDSEKETWKNRVELPLDAVGRYATTSLVQGEVKRRGTLQVKDRHGFELEQPLVIDFDVQTDEKPQVHLPRHLKEVMPMLEAAVKQFGFGVQAQDDYGVLRVVLHWRKRNTVDPSIRPAEGSVERTPPALTTRAVVSFEKVFEGLSPKSGDLITFWVEAEDNCPKKQTMASRRCSIRVHQEDLGDLTVRELGFGGNDLLARERIARSTRATSVKEPEGLKTREMVSNKHEANSSSRTQAPSARGEHAQATRDYFRLLSKVKYPEPEPKKP